MNKLKVIQKEYQKLNHLLINAIGKRSSRSKDWKIFESNNKSVALNIFYVAHNTEEIRHAYKSKHNLNRKN